MMNKISNSGANYRRVFLIAFGWLLAMWATAAGIKLFGEKELGAHIFIFLGCCVMPLFIHRWAAAIRGRDFILAGNRISGAAEFQTSLAR